MKEHADFVWDFINQTNQHLFLTGKAGTGKTTMLNEIVRNTHKQCVVVAPTGIAALNAGGVTIHSFFQLPFATFIPDFGEFKTLDGQIKFETRDSLKRHGQMNKKRLQLIRNLELLIIDEVSMLRADLLDAIDWSLKRIRQNNLSFGGLQVLFIGDLLQLPPVVKVEEWEVLGRYYQGIFFFHSLALQQNQPVQIELDKIYRQADQYFIELLNRLRQNQLNQQDIERLNQLVKKEEELEQLEDYITLTTHNHKARSINEGELQKIDEKQITFDAEVEGEFPPHLYPVEEELQLKKGAQVMFIKNDISPEKRFYNGKMGRISHLSSQEVSVFFPEENKRIDVEKYEWENIRYNYNEQKREVEEEVIGTFVQYPLKLAWAITVHKSQGLTFEKAILDINDSFASGQAYVALSRLRSLDGLVLRKAIRIQQFSLDQHVMNYGQLKKETEKLEEELEDGSRSYLLHKCLLAFDWPQLDALWRKHVASYPPATNKSEKAKHGDWARHQLRKMEQLGEPARKFRSQLNRLFADPEISMEFLHDRVQAAYNYFFGILDEILLSIMVRIELVRKKSKARLYHEELEELAEAMFEVVIHLKKARVLMEQALKEENFGKKMYEIDEIRNYLVSKKALAKQEARQVSGALDFDQEEEEEETTIPIRKIHHKKESKKKPSTLEKTLELVRMEKSIPEIARERLLSESTIYSHLARLISEEKLDLEEIMAEARFQYLSELFQGYEGQSLGEIKEKDRLNVSWEELRLFKAHLLK
ncbi:MAG: helicase [Bacteroidetes bacterium]|nr:MAG: helicase [Bacteroidota bacterium]